MDAFINVIKKDSQVQIKINDISDGFFRFLSIYRSKIGYDSMIQNVILKELLIITGYNNNRFR